MRPRVLAVGLLAGLFAVTGPTVPAGAAAKHHPAAHRMVREPVVVLRHVKGVTSFVVGYELNRTDETHYEGRDEPRASVKVRTTGGAVLAQAGQAPYYLRSPWSRCYTLEVPAVADPGAALGVRAGDRVRVDVTDRRGRRYGRTARVLADRRGRAAPGALSRRLGCQARYPNEAARAAAPLDPNSPACAPTKDGFPAACAAQF